MRQEGLQISNELLIASGGTKTQSLRISPYAQSGFVLPATFTGTGISFEVSSDNSTFAALYSSANALVSITVTQGRAYAFPLDVFPFAFVKLVSNGAEGGDRTIQISSKY